MVLPSWLCMVILPSPNENLYPCSSSFLMDTRVYPTSGENRSSVSWSFETLMLLGTSMTRSPCPTAVNLCLLAVLRDLGAMSTKLLNILWYGKMWQVVPESYNSVRVLLDAMGPSFILAASSLGFGKSGENSSPTESGLTLMNEDLSLSAPDNSSVSHPSPHRPLWFSPRLENVSQSSNSPFVTWLPASKSPSDADESVTSRSPGIDSESESSSLTPKASFPEPSIAAWAASWELFLLLLLSGQLQWMCLGEPHVQHPWDWDCYNLLLCLRFTFMPTIYGQTLLFLRNPRCHHDIIMTSLWLHLLHYDITLTMTSPLEHYKYASIPP